MVWIWLYWYVWQFDDFGQHITLQVMPTMARQTVWQMFKTVLKCFFFFYNPPNNSKKVGYWIFYCWEMLNSDVNTWCYTAIRTNQQSIQVYWIQTLHLDWKILCVRIVYYLLSYLLQYCNRIKKQFQGFLGSKNEIVFPLFQTSNRPYRESH